MFFGYVIKDWMILQQKIGKNTPTTWLDTLIRTMVSAMYMIWTHRCNELHKGGESSSKAHREITQEVTNTYGKYQYSILNRDAPLFEYDLQKIIKFPISFLRTWLEEVKEAYRRWKRNGRPYHGQDTLTEDNEL